MRPDDIANVSHLPLFRRMATPLLQELLQAAFLQRFPPHVLLMRQGDTADFLHLVLGGLIEQFAVHGGREFGLCVTGKNGVFPLAEVVSERPNLASVRIIETAEVLMIPAGGVRAMMERDQGFALSIASALAAESRCATKELASQKMRPSSERLANWLLHNLEPAGNGGMLNLRIDKRTLASLIGTTPENLSRNFGILAGHGVAVRGREIRVECRKTLTCFATPHPLIDDPVA